MDHGPRVGLSCVLALMGGAPGGSAKAGCNTLLVIVERVEEASEPRAEFHVNIGVELCDVPGGVTSVTVMTGAGSCPLTNVDGCTWECDQDFLSWGDAQAYLDGAWMVIVPGPSPRVSTFSMGADALEDADFFATPEVAYPPNGDEGIPGGVLFMWKAPVSGPFPAEFLHVSVDTAGGSLGAFLPVDATSWDPGENLAAGAADFDVGYYVLAPAELLSAIEVASGSIEWTPHPLAPPGYPKQTPLGVLGGWTEVDFTVVGCAGDASGDRIVDVTDLVLVVLFWGECGSPPGVCPDVNADGIVDVADLVEVIINWGPCP